MTPRSVVVTVAVGLVAGMIIGIVGIIALALLGKSPPDILSNITVGLVGACAGLLARTGTDEPPNGEPQQVQVVNTPELPAQVEISDEARR